MTLHCMLDLETWSTEPNAQIISIGAVKFDPMDIATAESFHVAIDPSKRVTMTEFHQSADTIMWWMSEANDAARKRWLELQKVDLGTALDAFASWLGADPIPVWGNGATFDNVILTQAYKAINQERPWGYREDRCFRTLKSFWPAIQAPLMKGLEDAPHDALWDALYQAGHMAAIFQHAAGR